MEHLTGQVACRYSVFHRDFLLKLDPFKLPLCTHHHSACISHFILEGKTRVCRTSEVRLGGYEKHMVCSACISM